MAQGCVRGASLAAGDEFNCGLLAAGGVYCWGIDLDGQVTHAPQTGEFTSVAAGRRHACALRTDNTLECWGNNDHGQAPARPSSTYGLFKSIACGDDFTCGVHLDGSPLCFGSTSAGKLEAPRDSFQMIATGNDAACGIRTDGTLACWGDDTWGLVSDKPGDLFTTVAVGPEHACAITSTAAREMRCWGNGSQTGRNDGSTRGAVRDGAYLAVSAGGIHTAAITVGYGFTCFSDYVVPSPCDWSLAALMNGQWYQVAARAKHTCVMGNATDVGTQVLSQVVVCIGAGHGAASPPDMGFKMVPP